MASSVMIRPGVLPGMYTLSSVPTSAAAPKARASDIILGDDVVRPGATFGSAGLGGAGSTLAAMSEAPSKGGKPYKGHPAESAFDERSVSFKGYYNESVPDSAVEVRPAGGWPSVLSPFCKPFPGLCFAVVA